MPLQHPSSNAELSLAIDASDTHIGGVMQQKLGLRVPEESLLILMILSCYDVMRSKCNVMYILTEKEETG